MTYTHEPRYSEQPGKRLTTQIKFYHRGCFIVANSGVLPPAAVAALRTLVNIDTEELNEAIEELADKIENGTVPASWHALQYQLEALVENLEDLASLCEEAAPEALQQPTEAIPA
jgi:hypothetical protein